MKLIFILTLTYIFVSSNNISANENIENCSIKNVPSKERIFSKNFLVYLMNIYCESKRKNYL